MRTDHFRLVFKRGQTEGPRPTFSLLVSAEMTPQFEEAALHYGLWNEIIYADPKLDEARQIAPNHFMGIGSTWRQFGTADEILAHAVDLMGRGGDMYYTLRSFDVMEKLANEGIPVQSHIGLIPTFAHWAGGLRAYGRTADEAMEICRTLKRMEDVGVTGIVSYPLLYTLGPDSSLEQKRGALEQYAEAFIRPCR